MIIVNYVDSLMDLLDVNVTFFVVVFSGPTMKLKRPVVSKMHEEEINKFYGE